MGLNYHRTRCAPCSVRLTLEGEMVTLVFDFTRVRALKRSRWPTVQLVTTRQTILDVLDARLTLKEAVSFDAILLGQPPTHEDASATRFSDQC